ncbi:MAG: hypothetical protein ACKOPC_05445 [Methylocystis sp.]
MQTPKPRGFFTTAREAACVLGLITIAAVSSPAQAEMRPTARVMGRITSLYQDPAIACALADMCELIICRAVLARL